jgi:hypothetical protein
MVSWTAPARSSSRRRDLRPLIEGRILSTLSVLGEHRRVRAQVPLSGRSFAIDARDASERRRVATILRAVGRVSSHCLMSLMSHTRTFGESSFPHHTRRLLITGDGKTSPRMLLYKRSTYNVLLLKIQALSPAKHFLNGRIIERPRPFTLAVISCVNSGSSSIRT